MDLKLFLRSLQQDCQRMDSLIKMMEQQYELLGLRRSQELESLNRKMLELMRTVDQHHKQREGFMASVGLNADKMGFRALQQRLPEPLKSQVSQWLKELAVKSALCRALNERSGKLLSSQRQLMQRVMGLEGGTSYPDNIL